LTEKPLCSARAWVALALIGVGLLGASACTDERSYVVVTVRAAEGEFTDVAQLLVRVWNGPDQDLLYYPRTLTGKYRFTGTETIDFSISLSTSRSGSIRVGVQPLDSGGRSLGYGQQERPIDPGHTLRMTVDVSHGAQPPPEDGSDAGVRPDGLGDSRSTCEPTSPTTCGAGRTCWVGCFSTEGVAQCTTAGARKPGEACTTTADCQPGTQCLSFGCGSVCVRHCRTDGECSGGRCNRGIPCGSRDTGYRFCSQPCDPRGDGIGGCAAGLACRLSSGDLVSCECPGPGRAEDGSPCTQLADCRPGLVCVGTGAGGTATVCRPVCKLADNDCAAGRTCSQLRNPDFTVWGACLPAP
jgi:hypothetical protein